MVVLNPADTICDNQDLAKRMGVPGRSRSGLECDLATARPGWFLRVEERLNANRTRETIWGACNDFWAVVGVIVIRVLSVCAIPTSGVIERDRSAAQVENNFLMMG
jgi:hypothetical protein